MMNLGGLDGSVSTLGGMVKLSGKAAGLARRAVYAVSVKVLSVFALFGVSDPARGLKGPRFGN